MILPNTPINSEDFVKLRCETRTIKQKKTNFFNLKLFALIENNKFIFKYEVADLFERLPEQILFRFLLLHCKTKKKYSVIVIFAIVSPR